MLQWSWEYRYLSDTLFSFPSACPESIQPRAMKNRGIYWRRYKIEETLYIGQRCLSPTKVGTLGPHIVLPIASAAPSYFPESHQQSEISSFSKVILDLGKARSHKVPNLGYRGAESPGWFDGLAKTLHKTWCMSQHVVIKLLITSCP